MILDDEIQLNERFEAYSAKTDLPKDPQMREFLAGIAIERLASDTDQARRILLDLPFEISSHYLVRALEGAMKQADLAIDLLVEKGPTQTSVHLLVNALAHDRQYEGAYAVLINYEPQSSVLEGLVQGLNKSETLNEKIKDVLVSYDWDDGVTKDVGKYIFNDKYQKDMVDIFRRKGPQKPLVSYLMGLLSEERTRDSAKEIMQSYGPTQETVAALINDKVLGDRKRSRMAYSLLRGYGEKAFEFMDGEKAEYIKGKLETLYPQKP